MTLGIYWRLDPAAEPDRSEPAALRPLPALVRDPREGARQRNRFDYYIQVAQAAAQTAFDGVFVRHRDEADESRIVAAVIARAVRHLLAVPEFPASIGSAVYAAKQAATFQRSTHGRLGWAITPDPSARSRESRADFLEDGEPVRRLDEFLAVARGVHEHWPFTYRGQYFEVQDGGFEHPLNQFPFPRVFLRGEDDEALALSARHADVHLFRPAPADVLSDRIARLSALAKAEGRRVRAGLIQPLLVREDRKTAEREAQDVPASSETLVAGYDEAADLLVRHAAAGIGEFVLEATPGVEEAYRIGQHLLPRLRARTDAARRAA